MKSILRKIIVWILTFEAKLVLKKHKPKIVAVTGTVGKTSTKDAIFATLSAFFHVRKSEKSYNSEIGVPLTILGLPNAWGNPSGWLANICRGAWRAFFSKNYPKWLVLEVGADHPGDIRAITKWLKTDVVVASQFSSMPVHVEFFTSPEAVTKEELSLADSLKDDGIIVVNADDELVDNISPKENQKLVSFGFSEKATVKGGEYEILYKDDKPTGIQFLINSGQDSTKLKINGVLGKHHAYPALAGIAVATSQAQDLFKSAEAISVYKAPPGRMNILEGINDSVIIDDSYNSSPIAFARALETLKALDKPSAHKTAQAGKKIVVMGDMLELGQYSAEEHKKAGELVAKTADVFVTVGVRSRYAADIALENGMRKEVVFHYDNSVQAGEALKHIIENGDVVLVKGSQGVRLEKTIAKILAHPEKKAELLVRQDKEWVSR